MSASLVALLPGNPAPVRGNASKLAYHPATERIAYAQGRTVLLRSLAPIGSGSSAASGAGGLKFQQPGNISYAQHAQPVTVARFSPTGFYCASGDISGQVRVWDVLGDELVLKLEYKALSGPIKDLAWDAESKRIIAVGEGREKFGSVFLIDGGSSAGTIEGHSKAINAVAINKQRPFRAITASDDSQLGWYNGAPYKLATTISAHSRFVQAVAFSPAGTYAISAGSDGKIFLFDGKAGTQIAELNAAASGHTGTIYGIEFHPTKEDIFASTGADGKLNIWQLAQGGSSAKVIESFDLNFHKGATSGGEDQQVALTFAGPDRVVTLAVSSDLHIAYLGSGGAKLETVAAPSKSISSISASAPKAGKQALYAGSYDGKVSQYDLSALTPSTNLVTSGGSLPSHSLLSSAGAAAVTGLVIHQASGIVVTVGLDDTLKWIEPSSSSANVTSVPLSGQPKALAVAEATGTAFVATAAGTVDVISAGSSSKIASIAVPNGTPSALAVKASSDIFAVGTEDAKVHLFSTSGNKPTATLTNGKSTITALAFSPDGSLLAAGESSGKIVVYDVSGPEPKIKIVHWVFHTARVNSIEFSPDGDAAVSGSLDTNIYVWSVSKPTKNISVKNAHAGGVNSVTWLDEKRIASAGADACVRVYDVKRHA